jgi:hypothetical protein
MDMTGAFGLDEPAGEPTGYVIRAIYLGDARHELTPPIVISKATLEAAIADLTGQTVEYEFSESAP